MGGGAPDGSTGWRLGARAARAGGADGRIAGEARRAQAGWRHLQRRSIRSRAGHARPRRSASCRSAAPRSASACWRLSWLSIAHFRRAGLMSIPSRSSRSSARKAATSVSGLPLISSVRRRRAGLADRAAAAGEPDPLDDAVLDPEHQRDPVAAQRVGALVRRVGILDDPEVVGPPVVLEDVVAVQVVHGQSSVPRDANPDQRGRD